MPKINFLHSPFVGKKIKKVAVLGGSGSFAIPSARQQNADAFITADLKYHHTKNLIFDYLTKKMPNFAIVLSRTKTNPVNYF